MAKKLKVYCVNYDGKRRRMTAAYSMTEAASKLGMTYHHFRNYGGETGNTEDCAVALQDPCAIWEQLYTLPGRPWTQVPPR